MASSVCTGIPVYTPILQTYDLFKNMFVILGIIFICLMLINVIKMVVKKR